MAFSTYIVETLKRHGSADLGLLGTFSIDYQPAKWQIKDQDFKAPIADIKWNPNVEESKNKYGTLAQVVSHLHDIHFNDAYSFVEKTIDKLNGNDRVDLGILGVLHKKEGLVNSFTINPQLPARFKIAPLSVQPIYFNQTNYVKFNWWLLAVSALFFAALFYTLIFLTESNKVDLTSLKYRPSLPALSNTSIREVNSAPSLNHEIFTADSNVADTTLDNIPRDFIIVTGTFCELQNLENAKRKITQLGYHLYEEKLEKDCSRIGILFTSENDKTISLEKIKNQIEPTAWILDK